MTDKKNDVWSVRKNKYASIYYLLMTIFAIFMLLLLFGVIDSDTAFFWWQV